MSARCKVENCGYYNKGYCTAQETIIGEDGVCSWLKNPRWFEPRQYQGVVNLLTLVKEEKVKDEKNKENLLPG